MRQGGTMSISKRESRQRARAGGEERRSAEDEPSNQLTRLRARIPVAVAATELEERSA